MIKIALTGIWYPVAMARYFWEALLRRPDVELWVAGPFSGRSIPWMGGMTLPASYVREPDYPLPMASPPQVVYRMLEARAPWKPDLWLEVNAGLHVPDRPAGAYARVLTDPHVLRGFYDKISPTDVTFCMQTPYMRAGEIWLPYAYDPAWHTPSTIPWEQRKYDAALIGLPYPKRVELVNRLRAEGMTVYLENGPAYDDAAAIYHDTRVGLNWSSSDDLNARFFELAAFALPSVQNRVTDAPKFLNDLCSHYCDFVNVDQAAHKVRELLDSPVVALKMADSARAKIAPHTWDARVQTILEEMA